MVTIPRDQMIQQSVEDYVRDAIFSRRGYSSDDVKLLEAFPYTRATAELEHNEIAVGFDFDDGGELAELGSDLIRKIHTVQFWVFAQTITWGQNLAGALQAALDFDGLIPLKDVSQAGAPVIDQLLVRDDPGPTRERQIIPEPEPWQEFVWTVHVRVEDSYYARLT